LKLAALTPVILLTAGFLRADISRLAEAVRKATGYQRQGLYQEAEKAAAEALSLLDKAGTPDFDVAGSLNDLGALAYAQGELERAERLFMRSRDAYQALAGPDDTRLAGVLFNLAGVYVDQGRSAQAGPLYRRALEIRESALGPAHSLVAEVANNLGFLYMKQGNYNEAESRLVAALRVWETMGDSHASYMAVALNNLAMLHKLRGGFDTAESLYRRALAAEERIFGRGHPEVAVTEISLAALYRKLGRVEMAIDSYRQALAALEKTLGAQDPLAVQTRAQLGELIAGIAKPGEFQILMVRTKKEAEDLRQSIEQGQDFAALATRYSIDPTASSGGYFQTGSSGLRQELRTELDRLGLGQVSGAFALAGNWAIVKRIK